MSAPRLERDLAAGWVEERDGHLNSESKRGKANGKKCDSIHLCRRFEYY